MIIRMSPQRRDRLLSAAAAACAVAAAGIVVLVLAFLLIESVPGLRAIGPGRFLHDPGWHPAQDAGDGSFNVMPMLVGTLATTVGAMLLAGPLGVLSALFTCLFAPPRLGGFYRRIVELLAGIPSVVYGLWGLTVLAPLIARIRPPGTSLLTGVVILTIMILPTVALLADAAIRNVSGQQHRAAGALALSRVTTIRRVILPVARSGVGVALLLGVARALGETMALLMVCGNVARLPESPLDPVRTLTANIALELGYAAGDHRAALFVTGLLLMAMVLGIVLVADRLKAPRHV
jgi:phosphate transport system permease protein